jgi:aminodeoxyfutalosine synthase
MNYPVATKSKDENLELIREKVESQERLTKEDALALFNSNDILFIGELAEYVNRKKNGNYVYFIVNRHLNPTNICINRCELCAFSRDENDPDAYVIGLDTALNIAEESVRDGATEIHLVGGLHPALPFDYYLKLISSIKEKYPALHIQAFTAVEIEYFSRITGLSIAEVLLQLKQAGLGSLPGGGAEIFNSSVRRRICGKKISGRTWLKVMETAHSIGLKSNATMLYGHLETFEDRVDHMLMLRELQDRTGGFQSFIPLAFHPENTKINKKYMTTGLDDLKTLAIARLFLDNFKHIKAFWIMLGEKLAQVSLNFGVDDLDGTVVEEKITHSAGAKTSEFLPKSELIRYIKSAGKIPVERDTLYNIIKHY